METPIAFGYARISKKIKEDTTLGFQTDEIKNCCSKLNWKLMDIGVEKKWASDRYDKTKFNIGDMTVKDYIAFRPIFDEIIGKASAYPGCRLVITKWDRLSRSAFTELLISYLNELNIIPYAVYDSNDKTARMYQGVGSQVEIETLKYRINDSGRIPLLKQGIYSLGSPFGYRHIGKKMGVEPDKKVYPLVEQILSLALENNSLASIRQKIDNKLSIGMIYRILTNPFYFGECEFLGVKYKLSGEFPINEEQHKKILEGFKNRKMKI